MELQGTPVFERNWDIIHEENQDGSRRYKILINEGSSRSSKTWSFFLILFLYCISNQRKRIIVLRETAVDCRENVESEFIDWLKDPMARIPQFERGEITSDDLDKFLEVEDLTQHIVENKSKHTHTFKETGSRITFGGADNVNKIIGKGNDVIWVNEPYKFPEEVLNQLIQRVKDFCLLDWNPKESHYIERYKKRDNAVVIHSTYKDNPFCPPEQKKHIESYLPLSNEFIETDLKDIHRLTALTEEGLLEYLQENDVPQPIQEVMIRAHNNERQGTADPYLHSVYALGIKAEKPHRIYKSWKKIPDAEYFAMRANVRPLYVVDWGVVDPFAIIELVYYDGTLYCHELNYKSENELKLLLNNTERAQVGHENADGLVTWMFHKLQIPQNRPVICDNNRQMKIKALQDAGWDYAAAIRKYPGSVIDGINILTNIKVCYTESSENIEHEQDNYSRKVSKQTGEVLEEPEDTNNHCFVGSTLITTNKGQKRIDEIKRWDLVLTSKGYKPVLKVFDNGLKEVSEYRMLCDTFYLSLTGTKTHKVKTKKGWKAISKLKKGETVYITNCLTVKNTHDTTERDITQEELLGCMLQYGHTTTENQKKVITYTTRMGIAKIIILKILRRLKNLFIYRNTQKNELKKTLIFLENFKKRELKAQRNGTAVKRVENGIGNTQEKFSGLCQKSQNNVNNAGKNIVPNTQNAQNIAIKTVNLKHYEQEEKAMQRVYDLHVSECHEYFANGLLVHNCLDAIRYGAQHLKEEGVIRG